MYKFKAVLAFLIFISMLSFNASAYADSKLEGYAQKGAYSQGSEIVINEIDRNFNPSESKTLVGEVTNNKGKYKFRRIPWKGWTEITVSGLYFNELTGLTSTTPLSLKAMTRLSRWETNRANTNLFTHLAAKRMQQRVINGEKRDKAWRKTQREVKRFFGLKRALPWLGGLNALNLNQGSGWFRKDNAILLLFTGGFLSAGGDATMLQNLTDDFADDGEFNGVGLSAFSTIARLSSAPELLDILSENMKAAGINNPPNSNDLPALPEWVDTTVVDTTAPVITIAGVNPVDIVQGASYIDEGASAVDDQDGEVSVITTGSVDSSTIGTYTITYTATDIAGNTAEATRTVNVILAPDTTPPVITVNGGDVTVRLVPEFDEYEDAGATAIDDRDGVVEVIVTGSVDTSIEGEYIILYTATDAAGNEAEASRTVTVEDNESGAPRLVADHSLATIIVNGEERSIVFATSLEDNKVSFYHKSNLLIDMKRGNQGGSATTWSVGNLSYDNQPTCGRPGSSYQNDIANDIYIDPSTGALTIQKPHSRFKVASVEFEVTATNDEGSSVMTIYVNSYDNPYGGGGNPCGDRR